MLGLVLGDEDGDALGLVLPRASSRTLVGTTSTARSASGPPLRMFVCHAPLSTPARSCCVTWATASICGVPGATPARAAVVLTRNVTVEGATHTS